MARHRTMVNISWSIQRARQGEQAYWATVALTALLGQLGTPGGGLGFGYACTNLAGAVRKAFSGPRLPAGENAVDSVIPVARLSDMLLHPGETYEFDGQQRRYPDIRLVYWAGGNAFHHHQDINRLCEAWRRPETVVVHEQYWTAQAKFSDIVLPATTSLEREDIGSGGHDGFMIAMSAQIPPVGEARDDYAIFCDLAGRLGFGEAFSEGRDAGQWLRHLYEESRPRAQEEGIALPSFDDFWQQGVLEYSAPERPQIFLADFRADPQRYPLSTPSGKIELFSATVAGFGYRECPGHPWWDEQEAARQRQARRQQSSGEDKQQAGGQLGQRIAPRDGRLTAAGATAQPEETEQRDIVPPGDRLAALRAGRARGAEGYPLVVRGLGQHARQTIDHHIVKAAQRQAEQQ